MDGPPGRPPDWQGPLTEVDRLETADVGELLAFLTHLAPAVERGETGVGLLLGARACADLGAVPRCAVSPVAVPEAVAVAYRRGGGAVAPRAAASVGDWTTSWSDAEHAAAVEEVRSAIAHGDVYQANVVGHRSAPYEGDAAALAAALPPARYAGSLAGAGWLVASASPEQLLQVQGRTVRTMPVKGTSADPALLRASLKDRAEHVMIVDLERNDVGRVSRPGSVRVTDLYDVQPWADVWHASSVVQGELRAGVALPELLAALVPGGSVTGAPKHAACRLLAQLEPVGRGPSMGALGFWCRDSLDLGLSIRTVALADGRVHLWAGGGITWGSDPAHEVAEAHAKAAPLVAALAQVRPSSS